MRAGFGWRGKIEDEPGSTDWGEGSRGLVAMGKGPVSFSALGVMGVGGIPAYVFRY